MSIFRAALITVVIFIAIVRCEAQTSEAVRINNDGVALLNKTYVWKDGKIVGPALDLNSAMYESAISKFEEASREDPTFALAQQNLSIAYNNYSLYLCCKQHDWEKALLTMHKALYVDPKNKTTLSDLVGLLMVQHKNPVNFDDRITLGDKALASSDPAGAIVEYTAALGLRRDDSVVNEKLKRAAELLRANEEDVDSHLSNLLTVQSDPKMIKFMAKIYKKYHLHWKS